MCGINVILDKRKNLDSSPISIMGQKTAHRGPDESLVRTIEGKTSTFHLSANRLRITDQSDNASQPFLGIDQKYGLLFNGEIYNFYDLKNELIKKNISFHSSSDTEVLYYWMREYGQVGMSGLKGMFAFIFIDFDDETILISRDRFGIKPLYYYQCDQYIVISSEIQSIISSGLLKKELNKNQIQHYLLYKYPRSPETFFKGIYELQPGHCMKFENDQSRLTKFYLKTQSSISEKPDVSKIRQLVNDSLLNQINVEVPLGLLLSGGVDSSLLLALARQEGYTLPTYSIVNSSKESSFGTKDQYYSRLASSIFGSDHHEVEVNINILDQFSDFISGMDQPIGDSAYLLTSEICQYASQSMKILLSGVGADEYFAGYNRHWAFYNYLRFKNILDKTFHFARPFLHHLPAGSKHPFRKHFNLIRKWTNSYDLSPSVTFQNYLTFSEFSFHHIIKDDQKTKESLFGWALEQDQSNFLVSDVLALSDKASMRSGIELRVPFLNETLVQYLNMHEAEQLIKYGRKWILKEMLKELGGRKLLTRPKEGFGLPISDWLLDAKASHLWENLNSNDNPIFEFLPVEQFNKIVKQQKLTKADHGPLLWSIIVLSHWLSHNF